jgi:hypothetical protein
MTEKFRGLPAAGGVTTIGGRNDSRPIRTAEQARQVQPLAPAQPVRRIQRSDQTRVQYEAMLKSGDVEGAKALLRQRAPGYQRPGSRDSAQALIDSGRATSESGMALAPGSQAPKVVQGPLHNRAPGGRAPGVSFDSIDGTSFQFNLSVAPVNRQGEPIDPESSFKASVVNSMNVMMLALRELALGGDPFDVFDRFGVQLQDDAGNTVFPVPLNDRTRPVVEPSPSEAIFQERLAAPTFGARFTDGAPRAPIGMAVVEEVETVFPAELDPENIDWSRIDGGGGPDYESAPGELTVRDEPLDPVDRLAALLAEMDADGMDEALKRLPADKLQRLGFPVAGGEDAS